MAVPVFLQQASLGGTDELESFTVISSEKEGYNQAANAYFRNVQAGDILLKMSSAGQQNLSTRSLPTGWQSLSSFAIGTYRYTAAIKIADGSESNTNTPNLLSGLITQTADYMVVLRPNVPILSWTFRQAVWKGNTSGSLASYRLRSSSMTTPTLFLAALHKDATTADCSSEISISSGPGVFAVSDSSGGDNTTAAVKMGIIDNASADTYVQHTNVVGGTYPCMVAASLDITV